LTQADRIDPAIGGTFLVATLDDENRRMIVRLDVESGLERRKSGWNQTEEIRMYALPWLRKIESSHCDRKAKNGKLRVEICLDRWI
jgi:hypothetical protein